jgi:hypothetical protein
MTEHILLKKIKRGSKEMIEISLYGDYEILISMLVAGIKTNKIISELVADAFLVTDTQEFSLN